VLSFLDRGIFLHSETRGYRPAFPLIIGGESPHIAGPAFSGRSATFAPVVRSAAIEATPYRVNRTTLVGPMIPAFTMST
jgi:hypothetical protein